MAIKKTELEKIARQLRAALEIIEAELTPVEVPAAVQAEVERKIANRICLAWDHPIPEGDTVYRGLCESDYSTTMARIRRGEDSEPELMKRGELGPKSKPGRKAARDIAHAEKMKIVSDDLEVFKKKRANKKKAESDE
jgi:hypothetical protein